MSDVTNPYRGIPKAVRVGCYVFQIEIEEPEDAEAHRSFGHMNPINQKIRLRPGMNAQNLANTFIHEVLHAVHWYAGVMGADHSAIDVEEEYTTHGANGLCAFWQDNPKACTWWNKLLKLEVAA